MKNKLLLLVAEDNAKLANQLMDYRLINGTDKTEELIADVTGEMISLLSTNETSVNTIIDYSVELTTELDDINDEILAKERIRRITDGSVYDSDEMEEEAVVNNVRKPEPPKLMLTLITVFMMALIMLYLSAVTFLPIPPENADTAKMITGALLSSGVVAITSSWFGDRK